jgi:hypothetical protein
LVKSLAEQRIFDRVDVRFAARLYKHNKLEDMDLVVKDFSPVGLKVFSTQEVSLFDRLLVSFIPHGEKTVDVHGYVVWIQRDSPCSWHIGVQFDQMDLLKANRMIKYIQESPSCPEE